MRNNKGITLIALVITIIVLLILAGVSIAMVTGQNGILNQASRAGAETQVAEAKELAGVQMSSLVAQYYEERYVDHTTTAKSFKAYLATLDDEDDLASNDPTKYSISNDGTITIKPVTTEGKTVSGSIDDDGKITWTIGE